MEEQQPADAGATVRAIPVEEIALILALNPIFAQFDRSALLAVAEKCRFATFEAGATIIRQGDPGNFAYVILEGEVDIFVEIPAPAEPIRMSTLGRDRTIGELGAFTDMPRTATAVARTDLRLLRIDGDSMMVHCRERTERRHCDYRRARPAITHYEPPACLFDLRCERTSSG